MRRLLLVLVTLLSSLSLASAETLVTPGARVAIVGDSITEQKLYSKFVEAYLLACSGVADVRVFQYGWGGETAAGFSARLENDLTPFKPTVVTLCYGMNDGGYRPFDEAVGRNYETNMRSVLKKLDAFGVKKVVVGSPGAVDSVTFRPGLKFGDQPAHVAYNDNLAHLRDIDRRLAEEHKLAFADVHAAMYDAMPKAKAVLGERYDVCGGDGFHPGPNGQLAMAYAFLKGLGVDGQIGEITIDLKGGSVASTGHSVVATSGGTMDLSSTRWPFCFDGDGKTSSSTRSIVPFLPFNEDLNRLTLKVKNLESAKAKVTWGAESKEFTREQLTAGVNLVAEFSTTPFDASFQKLIGALGTKQAFETYMIKQVITTFRSIPAELKDDAELQAAFKTLTARLSAHHEKLDAAARATLVPVKHSLRVEGL
jgi:lysophospholipase L1-like esterase